jgi:hypothetical protein
MGWVPTGVSDLDSLADVTITDPVTGQTLVFDGTEWVNGELLEDVATTKEVVAEAAPHTVQPPYAATYHGATDRTYIAYLGHQRDLYITYYDHAAASFATPVEIFNYPLSDSNNHGAPALAVDHDGRIHIVWGSHNSTHRHSRSDNPDDISAWTTTSITTSGTYPNLDVDPATGDLYLLDRAGSGHGATFPTHEYGSIRISTDGTTWSAAASLVDTTGTPEAASDFYLRGAMFGDDGLLHFAWQVARGSSHDGTRTNIYHAKYDPSVGNLYSANGTNLGTEITWAEHPDCLAVDRSPVGVNTLTVSGGMVVIPYTAGTGGISGPGDLYVAVWDGSSWTDTDLSLTAPSTKEAFPAAWKVTGGWRLALPILNGSFGDVVLYGALNAGTNWFEAGTLLSGASGEGFAKVAPVKGGGPVVALTQEEATSFATTSATVSDLVPLHAIFTSAVASGDIEHGELSGLGDDDHTQYVLADGTRAFTGTVAGVTPTTTSHLATKGYVDANSGGGGGSGEILISDTPSTPLVFADLIQNEAQDDLVYGG